MRHTNNQKYETRAYNDQRKQYNTKNKFVEAKMVRQVCGIDSTGKI